MFQLIKIPLNAKIYKHSERTVVSFNDKYNIYGCLNSTIFQCLNNRSGCSGPLQNIEFISGNDFVDDLCPRIAFLKKNVNNKLCVERVFGFQKNTPLYLENL